MFTRLGRERFILIVSNINHQNYYSDFAFGKLTLGLAPLCQVLCRSWDGSVKSGLLAVWTEKRWEAFMLYVMQKETNKKGLYFLSDK